MPVAPLVGKQRASVQHATARLNIWEGAVRSSKTVSSLLAWLRYVRHGPPGNLVMVGKTERTLKRNVIDPLEEMLGRNRCRYVQGAGELHLLGRRIYTAGANDERAEGKIRGLTLSGAYVDEASLVPQGFWSMLLTRLSVDGASLFATSNPDSPNHWLLKEYLSRASTWICGDGTVVHRGDGLDLARFTFRLTDNPHLSEAYKAALAAEFVGLFHRRFVLGEWVAAEGAIYDMLRIDGPDTHVVADLPEMQAQQWWYGVDYGTTNPFVALLLGLGVDERMYVAREWRWDSKARRGQLTDGQYSERLTRWRDGGYADLVDPNQHDPPVPLRLFVDPSAASFHTQLWRDGWQGVTKADNSVLDGIRSVSSLLAARRLLVHASCTGLIDELSGYVWDPKAQKQGEDAPLKQDDHGPDALRYAVMGTRNVWRRWQLAGLSEAA